MRFLTILFARFFARFFDKNFKFFNHLNNKREIVAWSFYDFANQPFTTIIITFLFAPYFADVICSSEEINGIRFMELRNCYNSHICCYYFANNRCNFRHWGI